VPLLDLIVLVLIFQAWMKEVFNCIGKLFDLSVLVLIFQAWMKEVFTISENQPDKERFRVHLIS
jgi:ATP/ADP translocase